VVGEYAFISVRCPTCCFPLFRFLALALMDQAQVSHLFPFQSCSSPGFMFFFPILESRNTTVCQTKIPPHAHLVQIPVWLQRLLSSTSASCDDSPYTENLSLSHGNLLLSHGNLSLSHNNLLNWASDSHSPRPSIWPS